MCVRNYTLAIFCSVLIRLSTMTPILPPSDNLADPTRNNRNEELFLLTEDEEQSSAEIDTRIVDKLKARLPKSHAPLPPLQPLNIDNESLHEDPSIAARENTESRLLESTLGLLAFNGILPSNGFLRLKSSIDFSPKESSFANVTNSNFSITELQKPLPAKDNLFTWNLHLNISKYVNNSVSKGETGQTKINHQSPENYLNLSIALEGGGHNNEDVFRIRTSVGHFIKNLFKTESSTKVSDFYQNKEHQIDTKKFNIDEISQNKDETLGSFSSTSHLELPEISDTVEVLNNSTENMEENELASKQKEGKFLFGLFGFGASQSAEPLTEVDVGSGILRSGNDVSDLINASKHFADKSELEDTEQQSPIKGENINLTDPLMFGITEIPSEEKIVTQSSILVSDIDSFQTGP